MSRSASVRGVEAYRDECSLDSKGSTIEVQLTDLEFLISQIEVVANSTGGTDTDKLNEIKKLIANYTERSTALERANADLEQVYLMARLLAMQPRGTIN